LGVVPLLVALVSSPHPDVLEQAVWALTFCFIFPVYFFFFFVILMLSNLVSDSAELRKIAMEAGFFDSLLPHLDVERVAATSPVSFLLSSTCTPFYFYFYFFPCLV
jgi:hypothetical protein